MANLIDLPSLPLACVLYCVGVSVVLGDGKWGWGFDTPCFPLIVVPLMLPRLVEECPLLTVRVLPNTRQQNIKRNPFY